MKLRVLTLLACFAADIAAANYSFVVLNHASFYSLVRISPEGKYISTIANGFAGEGLAKDPEGNYLVTTVTALLRVTPSGGVSRIATAPAGSHWLKVIGAPDGSSIVTDNVQHALWRVSKDGQTITKIANYPVPNYHEWESTSVAIDGQGNYKLLEDNHRESRLYKINPEGAVTEIPLSSTFPWALGLIGDGPDGYLAAVGKGDGIIRITNAGEVKELATFVPGHMYITGIARDPVTGEILATVTREHAILRISADGRTATTLTSSATYIKDPLAILAEIGQ
jgi:hypothetical protein